MNVISQKREVHFLGGGAENEIKTPRECTENLSLLFFPSSLSPDHPQLQNYSVKSHSEQRKLENRLLLGQEENRRVVLPTFLSTTLLVLSLQGMGRRLKLKELQVSD